MLPVGVDPVGVDRDGVALDHAVAVLVGDVLDQEVVALGGRPAVRSGDNISSTSLLRVVVVVTVEVEDGVTIGSRCCQGHNHEEGSDGDERRVHGS